MTIAAVLACRVGSKRMYGKPLMKIGEKTILELLIERLKTSKLIDKIVLGIADGEENRVFISYAKKLGLEYVIGDENDVLGRLIKGAEHVGADTVARVTPDCPMIFFENLDEMIQQHIDNKADMSFTQKLPLGGSVEILSLDALKKCYIEGEDRHKGERATLYINENRDKFKIRIITPPIEVQRPDILLTVDTPEDLEVMREVYNALQNPGRLIKVREAIAYFDKNPEITKKNKDQARPHSRIWE